MINWTKSPEIRWEKSICAICGNPTGHYSQCEKIEIGIDPSEDDVLENPFLRKLITKTIEYKGMIISILNENCYFKRYNNYLVQFNYPITETLAKLIGNIEGIERFLVETKYRGMITIGGQFDDKLVRATVNDTYKTYVISIQQQYTINNKKNN